MGERSQFRPENEELYQIIKKIVHQYFDILNPICLRPRVDVELQILLRHTDIEQLPEFHKAQELIQKDPNISKFFGKTLYIFTTESNLKLVKIIHTILKQLFLHDPIQYLSYRFDERLLPQDPTQFPLARFDKIYNDLECFFSSKMVPYLCSAPLRNFSSDLDEIDLGDGIRIVRVFPFSRILPGDRRIYGPEEGWSIMAKYWVEVECNFPVRIESKDSFPQFAFRSYPHERFYKFISALRLFKPGLLNIQIIKCTPLLEVPYCDTPVFHPNEPIFDHENDYFLNKDELNGLQSFWQFYNAFDFTKYKNLQIALRRLNFACTREKIEDQIIDLAISFESLLTIDSKSEIVHKLAVRTSKLVEPKEIAKRKIIFQEMKRFYDFRSGIAHGSHKNVEDDLILDVYKYLRSVIRKYMEQVKISNPKNAQAINEEWLLTLDLQ